MSTKQRIALVIEDTEDQNLVFSTALDRAGFSVESIFDGAVAQKRLAETVPFLVVLDMHLPEVNGNFLLKQIRSDPRLKNTRVILATADAALAEDISSQADLVLLKPISFVQLNQFASRFFQLDDDAP